ncbi:hypothetical protein DPMN_145898 [Dreissena polymorpha]|uniref:NACHT domain-containing protein n=1 Tax=Dreissena polymorpha TaxID=45954 RepID=A0A9D4F620_DREPO|nr:hypothetical protein DPMN_145898 [Dreissena polymorpha]
MCLANDGSAQEAVRKLRELANDVFKITTAEMIQLLKAAKDTLKQVEHSSHKTLDEIRVYLKRCKKDLKQHVDTCKQELDQHTEKCKGVLDGYYRKPYECNYEQCCEDFRERLIKFYTTTKTTVSVSPLREGRDKPIWDVFVQPKLSHVTIEKDGSRKKTRNSVLQYKALFYKDEMLSSRVFVQGEPGMGKTTFLTKLALDWCDAVSEHNPDHRPTFSDVDTLKEFRFLFQISLRDAKEKREVIEMIKTQIIDMIYPGEVKRDEAVKLLPHILERETYIVSMDGLNEWVDHLNQFVIPFLAQCHSKCVSIITSRPWKMADERIKDSEIKTLIEVEGIIDTEELANKIINSLQTGNVKTTPEFMKYVNERQFGSLLKSPWLQTLLVNCWMNKIELSRSLCEINCILLDTLFKNALAEKGYFQKGNSFQCLTNTSFIQQQINIFDALANVAFNCTFSSSKSPVFTEREVLNHMSEKQLKFCLNAGVLTQRYSFNIAGQNAQFSFLHETLQEFMTAYHIANSKQDLIKQFRTGSKYNVLEMSQTIIYLCGLDCKKANTLINCLVDDEFLKAISYGLSMYIKGYYHQENLLAFQDDNGTRRNVLKSNNDNMDYGARCNALSVLFQRMIIAGCIEATASGEKEIRLNCRDFIFNKNLTESDSKALELLLLYNCADVRSLIVESNCLQKSEILTVIHKSKHCLTRVMITMTLEISKELHHTSIRELNCIGQFDVSSCSYVLPSLSQLTYLSIEDTSFLQDIALPETIQNIVLSKCKCSSEWLCRLLITFSSLDHPVECELYDIVLQLSEDIRGEEAHTHISDLRSEIRSHDLSNIDILVENGSRELFELLRDTSIGILNLRTANCASLASEILHTLNKLTKLYLWGTYTGRCDLRLPASLQCISLQECECSSEWLCSLLITLSSLDHPVKCELLNVVLQLSEDIRGEEAHTHISDLRSEIRSHDLSNIEILVENGSRELFELLRDTSIGILNLRTANCASLASEILHTLNKLTKLYLWGTYTGRCDLRLPASLQCISLQECECSSEWLCSLLITLSSLDHPVKCELLNVVLQLSEDIRGDEANTHISDLRSQILSHDLSNIEILVNNDSKELFELLRDTSIGILYLRTANCASLASEILHTLNKLTKLYLWGTYTGRCDLRMPASLQCISLQECECSSEWLCSLLITLSSLDHPVKCELLNVVLQLSEDIRGDEANTHISDLRSQILSHDLSNIEILVNNDSKELFELLRDTSIGILYLRTANCASLASEILHTLNKLTKLYLWGTYTGRCDLRMPASLQCISLQECECSSEWLCSLLITLSSLDHPVKCELLNVVLQLSEDIRGDKAHTHISDLRSQILSHDMSNINLIVKNGSKELFELLRDTSIGILGLMTANCASLASEILHTLNKLTKLYLWGTYTGRCDLRLPASLQCISLQECECSSEWLCSLLITLSSLDHPVKCELWNVVLQLSEDIRGDEAHTHMSDLRSEILSHDLSNIEILVKNGSRELFEVLRDTSIGILDLRTAECASLASEILHSLNKLTKLDLWGTYTGRCDLRLPASLQCISLQECECSSEWLCSLLITLSSLDYPVQCELCDVVLQLSEDIRGDKAHTHISDLRSQILSHDMSNINLIVKNGSKELFELLRDTSIGILGLMTANCASLASEILHTLNKLTKLYLWGTYTGRCDLRLPASLQCISLQECECSSEWLCSLLITLSSLDHPVKCELWNVVLQLSEDIRGDEAHTHMSDLRSEILSHDLSNIEILVKNGSRELFEVLRDTSIGILDLRTAECASLASEILHSLNKLTELDLWGTYTGRCDMRLPASLQCISLQECECSSEWLCSLLITLSSLDYPVQCELCDVVLQLSEDIRGDKAHTHISDLRSQILSHDMSNINLIVKNGSKELFELLRDTSIGILGLMTANCASLASEILHTLNKLTKLYLWGTYTGRCDLRLPASLQCISLQECECSSEWLCSLLITLSSLDHPVKCELWNVVLQLSEDIRGDEAHTHMSDLRSEILSHDLSNIEILVKNGSRELFEVLRDTSIGILDLRTAECASLASEILHSLNKLTKLDLWGTYTGRCDLRLPASLQCISLQECECSSEWLCSLLITLSSLDYPVQCELCDVVLQLSEDIRGDKAHTHISDLRSQILSHDMSNINLIVKNGSKELFELLRDTSIGILGLMTANCASLASEILHTLNKLTKLYLWGTYTGRCDLRLPASLQCISLQECECSSEWLCSLLITLSSLDHPVKCELWNVVLQLSEDIRGDEAHTHMSDLRSEILSHDLSNIEILVKNGSRELFEVLRDTSIGILDLRTAECASLASEILHSLNKLTKLYLWGTYTGKCDLRLPASLQCISLQECECSSEWLCSLLITLSSLDHPVQCELWNVVLQLSEDIRGDEAHTHISDLRSQILSNDLSNIEIIVNNGSKELFELLRDTSIGILDLRTANCISLASEIFHTLNRLTKLYLWGTYTGRCDLRLPASLQCIILGKGECSSEWLCSLLITLSSLDHPVECVLWNVVLQLSEDIRGDEAHTHISDLRSQILSNDLSNIEILVENGSKELFELLRDTSIGILTLGTAECASLASEILHTLNKLTKLYLWGTYTGTCDLRLPASLQCISLQKGERSSEWLCSLLITLSSLDHPVECELWDVVLQLSEDIRGDEAHTHISDLRSEILSNDLSNIEILVENGSKELFELLRDTSIGILDLRTADCASLASEILHTLNKLTKLYLRGNYTGRCDLRLPASLQCISLQKGERSSEWLCSLLITLSSLDHPVECQLWNVVLQLSEDIRGNEAHTHISDLRSQILSHDLSNVEINVKNGSKELFELLSDTSIGSLIVTATDSCTLETIMRRKLSMLKEIHLLGIYLTRFEYDLPESLEWMYLQGGKNSLELLYSVLIKLAPIKHHVQLDVGDCFVISSNEICATSLNDCVMQSKCSTNVKADVNDSSNMNVSDLHTQMVSCDMSNIELRVLKFHKERFEMLRGTSIRSVQLQAFDDVSLTFVTQNTLPAFTEIRLQGTYLTDFNHTLPPTLQLIILQEGSCSSDWLYSLMLKLSTLNHAVRVFLDEYVVLQRREAIKKDPEPLMRGADLSSVKLEVFKDCLGLYETLPTMHITSLNITKIEHADLLSQTLPLLTHLQQLRICLNKYDMEMKLPECIKYVFIIYKKVSPSSLQQYVNNLSTIKHSVKCKLLFRVEENDDEYTRIKQDFCELKSVDVQHFEIVNKKGTARRAAALTLSATADDCDDDYDKRLLRWEGEYVDSKPWIHYCKIRLNILYTDACGVSS